MKYKVSNVFERDPALYWIFHCEAHFKGPNPLSNKPAEGVAHICDHSLQNKAHNLSTWAHKPTCFTDNFYNIT